MTLGQAKSVDVGTKIVHSDGIRGEVIELGYNAFKVRWSDGVYTIYNKNDEEVLKEVWLDDERSGIDREPRE